MLRAGVKMDFGTTVIAIDVDFVRLPTTPLELLVTTLVISLVIALAIMLVTLVLSPLVDKRWPATQPLNPTELLWAETGGYVQSHFRGLDFDIARDVAGQMSEKKVKAGQFVFEQGDPPAAFFVVKDGQVEVLQRVGGTDQVIRTYGPGDSFGEVAILRRSARTAGVRALQDTTLLELPADEFVAATALSAAEENPLLTAVDRYLAEDRARLATASVATNVERAASTPRATEPVARVEPGDAPAAPAAPSEEEPPRPRRPRRSALLDSPPSEEPPTPAEPAAESPAPRRRRFLADDAATAAPAASPPPAAPVAEPVAAPQPAPAPAPQPAAAPQPAPAPQPAAFAPTHRAPGDGALAWDHPDATRQPVAQLPPGEFVQVIARHGEWVQVRLSTGWQGWVDGRRLYPA